MSNLTSRQRAINESYKPYIVSLHLANGKTKQLTRWGNAREIMDHYDGQDNIERVSLKEIRHNTDRNIKNIIGNAVYPLKKLLGSVKQTDHPNTEAAARDIEQGIKLIEGAVGMVLDRSHRQD